MGAAGLSVLDMLSLRILNQEQQLAVVFNPVLDHQSSVRLTAAAQLNTDLMTAGK